MNTLGRIAGKPMLDQIRKDEIRRICQVEDINAWMKRHEIEWNERIYRTTEWRIVRTARDKLPSGKQNK